MHGLSELSVSPDVLERLAFHSGVAIELGDEIDRLVLDGVTYISRRAVA